MGAINYKTSDFITLGYNTNNIDYDDDFYYDLINEAQTRNMWFCVLLGI